LRTVFLAFASLRRQHTHQCFASSPDDKDKGCTDRHPILDILRIERPNFNPSKALGHHNQETANDGLDEEDNEIKSEMCFEDRLHKYLHVSTCVRDIAQPWRSTHFVNDCHRDTSTTVTQDGRQTSNGTLGSWFAIGSSLCRVGLRRAIAISQKWRPTRITGFSRGL
jgi:hypothetical protein